MISPINHAWAVLKQENPVDQLMQEQQSILDMTKPGGVQEWVAQQPREQMQPIDPNLQTQLNATGQQLGELEGKQKNWQQAMDANPEMMNVARLPEEERSKMQNMSDEELLAWRERNQNFQGGNQ